MGVGGSSVFLYVWVGHRCLIKVDLLWGCPRASTVVVWTSTVDTWYPAYVVEVFSACLGFLGRATCTDDFCIHSDLVQVGPWDVRRWFSRISYPASTLTRYVNRRKTIRNTIYLGVWCAPKERPMGKQVPSLRKLCLVYQHSHNLFTHYFKIGCTVHISTLRELHLQS
jgi:hypothetical protein